MCVRFAFKGGQQVLNGSGVIYGNCWHRNSTDSVQEPTSSERGRAVTQLTGLADGESTSLLVSESAT